MTAVKIASNAVIAKILNADKDVKVIVRELLSYYVEGREFMSGLAGKGWDGRSSFFALRTSTFPAGFVHLVHSELVRRGYTVQIVRKRPPEPTGPEDPVVDSFGNADPRYDYQMQTVRQLLKHGRGIAQVATGGGKSKIAKLCVARVNKMTLFITTRGVLMYQMKKAFEKDMGRKVGVIGDGIWEPRSGINVAMVQTLIARLSETSLEIEVNRLIERRAKFEEKVMLDLKAAMVKRKLDRSTMTDRLNKQRRELERGRQSNEQIAAEAKAKVEEQTKIRERTLKFLDMVEFVIGEEAHEAGGNSYYEILQHCKNAHYRLALTATPFMRSDAEDNMRLMAAFGPILIQVTEKTLIDRGILATPYFKLINIAPPKQLFKSTAWDRAYKIGITENVARNEIIVMEARRAVKLGLPVMILVQRKAHGKVLLDKLHAVGVVSEFILGESSQENRESALARLGAGKLQVLIGTTILDVGVDVPAVGMVILAGGGKAEVALRQRIGRGLRSKKSGPNVAFIIDFVDEGNQHLRDHARQRRAIIESTPGFVENILEPGKDFPWKLFEEKAA